MPIVCHFVQTFGIGRSSRSGSEAEEGAAVLVAEDDRAAGAAGGQLDDVHVLGGGVVVEVEADLVAVEGDRAVDVADREDDDLEGPVHAVLPLSGRIWGRDPILSQRCDRGHRPAAAHTATHTVPSDAPGRTPTQNPIGEGT